MHGRRLRAGRQIDSTRVLCIGMFQLSIWLWVMPCLGLPGTLWHHGLLLPQLPSLMQIMLTDATKLVCNAASVVLC
jgi:hypothetical protein